MSLPLMEYSCKNIKKTMSKQAKLRFRPGSFDVLIEGDYIICAVSKKKIQLQDLKVLEC